MNQTVDFIDQESGQRAFAMIRVVGDIIAFSLSVKGNGDIDVAFTLEDAERLILAVDCACQESGRMNRGS